MLIAIDGSCKRNGQPTCVSCGVAWIETEQGDLLYKSSFEHESTSQRGEIQGLLVALEYALQNAAYDEDIIIITDSEYLYNTVEKNWVSKWANNSWIGSTGSMVKNQDLWEKVLSLLTKIESSRVFMQWTKGHIVHYTPKNIRYAMAEDATGVELYSRICSMADRPADRYRIISDFNNHRHKHFHHLMPDETAIKWAVFNTTADCIAQFVVQLMDNLAP